MTEVHWYLPYRQASFWGMLTIFGWASWYYENPYFLFVFESLLAAAFLSLLYLALTLQKLKVERKAPSRAFEGQLISIEITLQNPLALPLRGVCLTDSFGGSFSPSKIFQIPWLAKGKAQKTYQGICEHERGVYSLGPICIQALDCLGLWRLSKVVEETRQPFVILPKPEELPFELGGGNLPRFGHTHRIPRAGLGYDFLGTREYRPGDSLRYIHWPATAHRGELIVKEFEIYSQLQITFYLDLSQKALQGFRPNTLDYSVKVVASLALRACREGIAFRLFAREKKPIYLPLGRGEPHYGRLLEMLSTLKPRGETPLEQVVLESLSYLDPGEVAFLPICTHLASPEKLSELLSHLKYREISPMIVFLLSDSFEKLQEDSSHFRETHYLPALCAEHGARVFTLAKGEPLEQSFLKEVSL